MTPSNGATMSSSDAWHALKEIASAQADRRRALQRRSPLLRNRLSDARTKLRQLRIDALRLRIERLRVQQRRGGSGKDKRVSLLGRDSKQNVECDLITAFRGLRAQQIGLRAPQFDLRPQHLKTSDGPNLCAQSGTAFETGHWPAPAHFGLESRDVLRFSLRFKRRKTDPTACPVCDRHCRVARQAVPEIFENRSLTRPEQSPRFGCFLRFKVP